MNTNYYSFLICDHGNEQHIYVNGLPIGKIENGQFIPHVMNKDVDRKITFHEVGGITKHPYKNMRDMKAALIRMIRKIEID